MKGMRRRAALIQFDGPERRDAHSQQQPQKRDDQEIQEYERYFEQEVVIKN